MDLGVVSVAHGPNNDRMPCSFTVFAWRMANGDDHKCGFIGVITLDQCKCPFRKQTLTGLVLCSIRSAASWYADGTEQPIEKNRAVHSLRDLRGRASLPLYARAFQTTEISLRLAQAVALSTLAMTPSQGEQTCSFRLSTHSQQMFAVSGRYRGR